MKWNIEDKIKLYSYYFFGIKKPIVIEARNRLQARDAIEAILPTLPPEYSQNKIVGETVKMPLVGITDKVIKGETYIWNGNGWQKENSK